MEDDKQLFQRAVSMYDFSYEMSDDHRSWQRGHDQRDQLIKAAAELNKKYGDGVAETLWDSAMITRCNRHVTYMTSTGM